VAHTVRVQVLGLDLKLHTDDDEAFVGRVAASVNGAAALLRQKGAPPPQLALFAAMQIAADLERERAAHAQARRAWAAQTRDLADEVRHIAARLGRRGAQ